VDFKCYLYQEYEKVAFAISIDNYKPELLERNCTPNHFWEQITPYHCLYAKASDLFLIHFFSLQFIAP
ncbi:MAG: hypothetical protein ACKODM_09570, partial [Cytophagales bacterium]